MTDVFVLGVSHHKAPLELREKLSRGFSESSRVFGDLAQLSGVQESLVISTCNRIEVYGVGAKLDQARPAVQAYMQSHVAENLDPYLYFHSGNAAIRHAFRVAASLDSMVVGEPQILGQVKQAMQLGKQYGNLGTVLGRCFEQALAAAKRVRAETNIASGAVSVSSVACDLAAKIFGDLNGCNVLLLGAGKMSEQAARKLIRQGAKLHIVNRSVERGEQLATRFSAQLSPFSQLRAALGEADVVIASTASQEVIVTNDVMKEVHKARRHRPVFFIDIAVPRNIESNVAKLDGVYLYDLDDLRQVSKDNLKMRSKEARAAEGMLLEHVDEFERWLNSLELTPTIVELRAQMNDLMVSELQRFVRHAGMNPEPTQEELERFAQSMTNKVLHGPLTSLKEGSRQSESHQMLSLVRSLFALDKGKSEDA